MIVCHINKPCLIFSCYLD